MKAAILDKYDKQGRSLTITDVPIPEIENGEVLVKVRTAGVNPLDNMIVRGEVKLIVPYTMPLVMGNEFRLRHSRPCNRSNCFTSKPAIRFSYLAVLAVSERWPFLLPRVRG